MRLVCCLSGQGVDDITVYLLINVQQNPGRGAKVANNARCPDPEKSLSNPSPWTASPQILTNQQLSDPQLRESLTVRNLTSFQEHGQYLKVSIHIPKTFFDILGLEQARIELVGLKRDITTLASNRLQDSVRCKIAGTLETNFGNKNYENRLG